MSVLRAILRRGPKDEPAKAKRKTVAAAEERPKKAGPPKVIGPADAVLYGTIIVVGIRTARRSRDRLGKLLAMGVVTMLFCHVFVNIGMNIRLVPVTGLPLPLLSSGGSSVVCSLMTLGLLQNVRLHQKTI